jgi:hypothetical protein
MQNLKDIFVSGFKDIRKNLMLFLSCVMLDILFIFSFGFLRSSFAAKALVPLQEMMKITHSGSSIDPFAENAMTRVTDTALNFVQNKSQIIWIAIFFVIAVTIVWAIFQGIVWYFSKNIVKKEKMFDNKFWKYYGKFFLISFFWAGVYIVLGLILLRLALPSGLVVSLNPLQVLIFRIGSFIALAILFFVPISFSLLEKKNPLKETFKIAVDNFLLFLIMYLIFVVASYLFIMIQSAVPSIALKIIIGLLTSIPLLTYFRITILKMVSRV